MSTPFHLVVPASRDNQVDPLARKIPRPWVASERRYEFPARGNRIERHPAARSGLGRPLSTAFAQALLVGLGLGRRLGVGRGRIWRVALITPLGLASGPLPRLGSPLRLGAGRLPSCRDKLAIDVG